MMAGFVFLIIQDSLIHHRSKKIDPALVWLCSNHWGRHKSVLSAYTIAEYRIIWFNWKWR